MRIKTFESFEEDITYLKPYHDKAKELDNPTLRTVGDIKTVKTKIGDFTGFYVNGGRDIIFYHPKSLAVLIEKGSKHYNRHDNNLYEISLDEVELLFK
jgi:hypothetical protein